MALTNSDDQFIRIVLNEKVTSEKVKQALQRALELRGKLALSQREVQQQQRQLNDITADQDRLRKNLREMPPTAAAYKRYLKKFDDQETQIEKFQALIKDVSLMPTEHRDLAQQAENAHGAAGRARAVSDYIAGMTDRYAILEHRRLFEPGERT